MDFTSIKVGYTPTEQCNETTKLFEEVIAKNFEIIKNMLPKMSSIYSMSEELQKTVKNLANRIERIEEDSSNIHYEMRTSNLSLDNKLNSITEEYRNSVREMQLLKRQTEAMIRDFHFYEQKDAPKDRQNKSRNEFPDHKNSVKFLQQNQIIHDSSSDSNRDNQLSLVIIENDQEQFRHKNMKDSDEKESILCSKNKTDFEINSVESIKKMREREERFYMMSSQKSLRRNVKPKTVNFQDASPSKNKFIANRSKQEIGNYNQIEINAHLKKIEEVYVQNQKIQKKYEELMSDYCKVNDQKIDAINQKLILFQKQVQFKILTHPKIAQMKIQWQANVFEIKNVLNEKIQKRQIQSQLKVINKKIDDVYEEKKLFANREETKKAIKYLESKLNKFDNLLMQVSEAKQIPQPVQTVDFDDQGCFRVTKCISQSKNQSQSQPLLQPDKKQFSHSDHQKNIQESCHENREKSSRCYIKLSKYERSKLIHGKTTENRFNEVQHIQTVRKPNSKYMDEVHMTLSNEHKTRLIKQLKKRTFETLTHDPSKSKNKQKKYPVECI